MEEPTITSVTLQRLVVNYETQAKEIKKLSKKVRELTRQRDKANARNAELRQHLARYQGLLALSRREYSAARPSAWVEAA